MLIIKSPRLIETPDNQTMVECTIIVNGVDNNFYYSTPKEWGKYLVYERADAFLLGVLQFAMKDGHDIEVEAPCSEMLFFNLVTQAIPILAEGFGHKRITVKCDQLDNRVLTVDGEIPFAVGTGCSLGVDSFACILYHTQPNISDNYRLTHLTYFNVGGMGNDTAKATASYMHDIPMIEEYADFKKMPLVTISSNIGELYDGWNFDHCSHSRNPAAVLALQKLFKRYYYASSVDVSHLKINNDAAYFESALVPYLSTENTNLMVGQAAFSRVDKTRYIAEYPETYNRLYVCWKEIMKNNYGINRSNINYMNCSRCEKCLRTMLTLHLLNKETQYKDVFDWSYFHKRYHHFIGYALANKQKKSFYEDIVKLMKQTRFRPSLIDRIWQLGLTLYHTFR